MAGKMSTELKVMVMGWEVVECVVQGARHRRRRQTQTQTQRYVPVCPEVHPDAVDTRLQLL